MTVLNRSNSDLIVTNSYICEALFHEFEALVREGVFPFPGKNFVPLKTHARVCPFLAAAWQCEGSIGEWCLRGGTAKLDACDYYARIMVGVINELLVIL